MLEDSEVATGHLGQLAGVTRRVVTVLLLASLSRSASLSVETSRNSRNDTGASVPTTCGPVELAMTELAPITQTDDSESERISDVISHRHVHRTFVVRVLWSLVIDFNYVR